MPFEAGFLGMEGGADVALVLVGGCSLTGSHPG